MFDLFEWLKNNAHWVFDGIGVTILVGTLGYFFKNRELKGNVTYIVQKGGKKSVNVQNNNIGGDKTE